MRRVLIGAVVLAGVVGASAGASAQPAPGLPGPPGGGMGGPGSPPPGGPPMPPPGGPGMGMMHGMGRGPFGPGPFGHGMPGMRPPKAAVFAFSRGDTRVMIKCADEEPTRACVEAAGTLIDKLAAASPR